MKVVGVLVALLPLVAAQVLHEGEAVLEANEGHVSLQLGPGRSFSVACPPSDQEYECPTQPADFVTKDTFDAKIETLTTKLDNCVTTPALNAAIDGKLSKSEADNIYATTSTLTSAYRNKEDTNTHITTTLNAYHTAAAADTRFARDSDFQSLKSDAALSENVYSKSEVYTKTETYNRAETYSRTQADTAFATKAIMTSVINCNAKSMVYDVAKGVCGLPAPVVTSTSGECVAERQGATRMDITLGVMQVCWNSKWENLEDVRLGAKANPATSCLQLGVVNGMTWIKFGANTKKQVYCNNGWALAAEVKKASCQAHWNRAQVGTQPVQLTLTATAKWSDADINAYREQSPYKGTTAYWMHAYNFGSCGTRDNFCSSTCVFDAVESVANNKPCALCAKTFEGQMDQLAPNTGTRGLGHHHSGDDAWFSWQRHPEQGSNCGFKSDRCGSGDGELWIR